MFLQSYVLPVCVYRVAENGSASVIRLHGTSFLIDDSGTFLSAAHVLNSAKRDARENGLLCGVVCKGDGGRSIKSDVARILSFEVAPNGRDVAIGRTKYCGPTQFVFGKDEIDVWQDVATYGYPIEAISGDVGALNLNLRAHKGYVQRLVRRGDIALSLSSVGFELSFLLARGLSGAPLFVHSNPLDLLVGVCVSSIRSEIVEDQIVEVLEDGREYRETRSSITEYGFAESLSTIADWKPDGFDGRSLACIATQM